MRNDPRHRDGDRIGPHRRTQRKGAAALGIMMRRLQHEVAARLIHPIEHDHVSDAFETRQPCDPSRVEHDGADGVALARNSSDNPHAASTAYGCARCNRGRRRTRRQFDGDFALAQSASVLLSAASRFASTMAAIGMQRSAPQPVPGRSQPADSLSWDIPNSPLPT